MSQRETKIIHMVNLRAFQWLSIIKQKWLSYVGYSLQGLIRYVNIAGSEKALKCHNKGLLSYDVSQKWGV